MKWHSSLLVRTVSLSGGTAAFMLGQLALLILIARLGTQELVGAYALSTAFLNPIFLLARMGLRAALATEHDGGMSFRIYRDLQFGMTALAFVVTIGIAVLFGTEAIVVYVLFIVFFMKLFETFSDLHYGLLLKYDRQHVIATSLFLRSTTGALAFLFIALTLDAETAMVALPLSWALVFLLHDFLRSRDLRAKEAAAAPGRAELVALFSVLLPLALAGFFGQLGLSVPRYFIGVGSGTSVLGQIAPALMAHVFVSAFADSVMHSLLSSVARDIAAGERRRAWDRLVRIAVYLLPVTLIGVAAMFAIGSWIVDLVFGEGYELAGVYIGIVSISWSLRAYGTLFGSVVMGARNFGQMFWINFVSFLVYAVLTLGLGLAAGLIGVLWGMVLGSLCYCLLLVYAASRRLLR